MTVQPDPFGLKMLTDVTVVLVFLRPCGRHPTSEFITNPRSQDEFVRLLAMHSSRLMAVIRIIALKRQDDSESG